MALTVIVAGAAGFIGRHVCNAFSKQGVQVLGVGHGNWDEKTQQHWGVSKWIDADISVESLKAVAKDTTPFAVLHCAGSGSVSASYADPYVDYQRTVDSTVQVLEFARSRPGISPRVVLTSSAAVYGDQGEVHMFEHTKPFPVSPYGVHKVLAENMCESYAKFFKVPTSVVRLFSVYGEGLRKQLLWDAMHKFSRHESGFFGTGNELRDWIHVEDAARLLLLAATVPQSSYVTYNGAHTQASTKNILSQLSDLASSQVTPVFNNEVHTGNPKQLTADCQHTRSQLGWKPEVDLEEGLRRYAAWFKAENA
jgi:UDP-glucose 4-epimerase